jgi:hypothetical protein
VKIAGLNLFHEESDLPTNSATTSAPISIPVSAAEFSFLRQILTQESYHQRHPLPVIDLPFDFIIAFQKCYFAGVRTVASHSDIRIQLPMSVFPIQIDNFRSIHLFDCRVLPTISGL